MKKNLKSLNKATEFADSDIFQTWYYSYRHAMRSFGESSEDAKNRADQFVREQFSRAKELLREGKTEQAYFEFGVELHTLQDATSPVHSGFKFGGNQTDLHVAGHAISELSYPGTNSNLQKVTNYYLDWFENSNKPLPTENLFNSIKHD